MSDEWEAQKTEQRKNLLSETFARFVERWVPRNRDDSHAFERDLMYLIHTTYEQAQAPFVKEFSLLKNVAISQPLVMPKKD